MNNNLEFLNYFRQQVFPANVRSGASGISGGTGYAFAFLANKLFLKMLATLTLPGTFFFYSGVAFIGAIILYFVLPETEGRSLPEIEAHFSGGLALSSQLYDEEKRSDVNGTRIVTSTVAVRPKTDVVIGISALENRSVGTEKDMIHVDLKNWSSDQIFQQHLADKKENVHKQAYHHHHHPLYVQNPRAYMRHNNHPKIMDNDNVKVFSTRL